MVRAGFAVLGCGGLVAEADPVLVGSPVGSSVTPAGSVSESDILESSPLNLQSAAILVTAPNCYQVGWLRTLRMKRERDWMF